MGDVDILDLAFLWGVGLDDLPKSLATLHFYDFPFMSVIHTVHINSQQKQALMRGLKNDLQDESQKAVAFKNGKGRRYL